MSEPNITPPAPDLDDLSRFEAKETSRKLPVGWLLLFWGLVAWGLWYVWTYRGWRQADALDQAGASSGANILATVAFTVIPTVAAIALVLVQRRKRGKA
jgi:hypothetical protein